jgi:hypothetical protein
MFVKVFFFPTPLLRYKLLVETILHIVGKCVVSYEHPVLTATKTVRFNCIVSDQKHSKISLDMLYFCALL